MKKMIRKATSEDLDKIMKIIEETKTVMHQEGNFQWDSQYPLRQHFQEDIREGTLYVKTEEGEVQGLCCINQTQPAGYEQVAWQAQEEAPLVIHRMAVELDHRKKGIAAEFMRFAEELASEMGITAIRTDTNSANEKMQKLFSRFGYQFTGKVWFRGHEAVFYCYEKKLNPSGGKELANSKECRYNK